jgi:hypothetical protein
MGPGRRREAGYTIEDNKGTPLKDQDLVLRDVWVLWMI